MIHLAEIATLHRALASPGTRPFLPCLSSLPSLSPASPPSPYNGNKLPSLGTSHLHPPYAVLFVSHSTTARGGPLDSRSVSTPAALLTCFVKITHDRPTSYSRLPQSYCTLASERLSTPDGLLETPSTVLPCFPFPVRNTSPLHSTLPTWRRCLPTARKGYLTSTPYHHLEAAEEQRAIDMQYMFNYGPQKKKKKKEKKSVLSCRV